MHFKKTLLMVLFVPLQAGVVVLAALSPRK